MTWPDALARHLDAVPAPGDPRTLVTDQQHRVRWHGDGLEVRHLVHGTRLHLTRGAPMQRAAVQLSREGRRHAWPWLRGLLGKPRVDWWLHVELRAPGDRHPLRLSAPVADAAQVAGLPDLHVRTGGRLPGRAVTSHVVDTDTLMAVLAVLRRCEVPVRRQAIIARDGQDAIAAVLDARLDAELGTSTAPEPPEEAAPAAVVHVDLPPLPPRPLLAGLVAAASVPLAAVIVGVPITGSLLWILLVGVALVGLIVNERRRLAHLMARQVDRPRSWDDIVGASTALWAVVAVSGLLVVEPWDWPPIDETAPASVAGRHWALFPMLVYVLTSVGSAVVEAEGRLHAPEMIGPTMPLTERLGTTLALALVAWPLLMLASVPLVTLSLMGPVVFGLPVVIAAALVGRAQGRDWQRARIARS